MTISRNLFLAVVLAATLFFGIGLRAVPTPLALVPPVISQLSDPLGDVAAAHSYIDVVEARILQIGLNSLQFEMTVASAVPLNPAPNSMPLYLWLLDTDQNPNTGQKHVFVGTEYNLRVAFYDGLWQAYVDAINVPGGGRTQPFVDGNRISMIVGLAMIGGAQRFNWEISSFDQGAADVADSYATATVSSVPPPAGAISEVSVTPSFLTLSNGVTKGQVHAVAEDISGNPVDISSTKFFVDKPSLAFVTDTGEVTASPQAVGVCWIVAQIDGVLSSNPAVVNVGSIIVLPPILLLSVSDNPTGKLTLQILDAAGNEIVPSEVHFYGSNGVAAVSDDGIVTAIKPPQAFGDTPYVTAVADGVHATNAAVIRVTQTSLGLTLDGMWGEHVVFYVPRQPIAGFNYQKIFTDSDVVRITDIAYELEHEATGVVPFLGGIQFLVNDPGHGADGTVPCGLGGNPVRLGTDVDKTVHNSCMIVAYGSGSPQWFVFFHEIGHNFFGEGVRVWQFMPGYASDWVYSEGLATALGMYAAKMLEARSSTFNVPQNILTNIESSVWHFGSTPDLDTYLSNGAHYNQMTASVLDDMIDVICRQYGYDSLFRFYSLFLPREKTFGFTVDSETDQATLFVAALGAATGADLRARFRSWGFPIDDTYYASIWDEVNGSVHQRWYPLVAPISHVQTDIVNAPASSVVYVLPDWQSSSGHTKPPSVGTAALSDFTALGFIFGASKNTQIMALDTNSTYFDPATGAPKISNSVLVVFAGWGVNGVVYYYEMTGKASPIYADYTTITGTELYAYFDRQGKVVASLPVSAGQAGTSDMFLVEYFKDANNNKVFIVYGFAWKGTYIGGVFFKTNILPHITSFTHGWYIYQWNDMNGNGLPDPYEVNTTPVDYGD